MDVTRAARRLFSGHGGTRLLVDAAIAAAGLGLTLVVMAHGGVSPSRQSSADLDALGFTLAAASTLALIAWRRFPLGVFVVTAAATVALAGLGYPLDLPIGSAIALYLLAASRDAEGPWAARTTMTVVGLLSGYIAAAAVAQGAFPASEVMHGGLAWGLAWFAGERTRLRHLHLAELAERALRAERDVERERLLAAAEERARIARDLHDSAGHAINVIAVQAGAARLRYNDDPARSLAALEAIEAVARQTAEEIDGIVGTLRAGDAAADVTEAPIGVASIGTLIARGREAGLRVTLESHGSPRPLGVAADQAVYRILQEALTNAARHGGGSARVDLAFEDDSVVLTATNPIPTRHATRSSGGHGLIGMRERATLLGGVFEAEEANGEFRVRARIPYGASAG